MNSFVVVEMDELSYMDISDKLINCVVKYIVNNPNVAENTEELRKVCIAYNVDLNSFTQKSLDIRQ